MKKVFFLISVTCGFLFSAGIKISPIPLPSNIFINLETGYCNKQCLQNLYENEYYFSFLSMFDEKFSNDTLIINYKNLFALLQGEIPEVVQTSETVKLAFLLSKKNIHKYASTTVNSAYAYLNHKKINFIVEVFDTVDENPSSLINAINSIKAKGYKFVIAPLTINAASFISDKTDDLLVYIPTVHKSQVIFPSENLIFGGIDYNRQIKLLLSHSNNKIITFSDASPLGLQLDFMVKKNSNSVYFENYLEGSQFDLKPILSNNTKLNNSSIFLNMPLVKTSLLASQLRSFNIQTYKLLSTQINYHPLLLSLTQSKDIENLIITNSISYVEPNIRNFNKILGNDIEYNWVDYSVAIGLDYFYINFIQIGAKPIFEEQIIDGQVNYNISLFKANKNKFLHFLDKEFY